MGLIECVAKDLMEHDPGIGEICNINVFKQARKSKDIVRTWTLWMTADQITINHQCASRVAGIWFISEGERF